MPVLTFDFQPFGKRSGSKADNRVLYPKTLISLARVVRPTTGRAVLLTQDKSSMFKVCDTILVILFVKINRLASPQIMGKINHLWKTEKYLSCNIGGLNALVFIMSRTARMVPK